MAVNVTRLDGVSGGPTSLTSNSITPGDNRLIFAYVTGENSPAPAGDPTISGGGLTWNTAANNVVSLFGFVGLRFKVAWAWTGTGSGTFTVTANFGSGTYNIWLLIDRLPGADWVNPVVQSTFASGTSTALNSNFAAEMAKGNGVWAGMSWLSDTATLTAGSGYTLLTPSVVFSLAGSTQSEWRTDIDPTPNADATASSSVTWAITGIEVKAAVPVIGGIPDRFDNGAADLISTTRGIARFGGRPIRRIGN